MVTFVLVCLRMFVVICEARYLAADLERLSAKEAFKDSLPSGEAYPMMVTPFKL